MSERFQDGLVSVILPAYRRADVLPRAALSVLDQTYRSVQLIVVDDGSGDGTADAADAVAQHDARMQVIRLSTNRGVHHARNVAIEAASGRYVAFLDSDDYWLPEKLSLQMSVLPNSEASLCFTGFRRVRSEFSSPGKQVHVPKSVNYRQLLRTNVIPTSTNMVDREKTGAFFMSPAKHDDYATWLKLLRNGQWAIGIDKDLMRYGISENSLSGNKINSAINTWKVYRESESMGIFSATLAFSSYATAGLTKHILTRA